MDWMSPRKPCEQIVCSSFEMNGKDGFRVPAEDQDSSAQPGQALKSLRAVHSGEALKSNVQEIDLSIHPEHHELVLVPCLHMLWSQAPHPLPVTLLAGPVLSPAVLLLWPSLAKPTVRRWNTQHTLGTVLHPAWLQEIPKTWSAAPILEHLFLLHSFMVKAPHKSAAGIQCTSLKRRFQTCSHTPL